jgi:hypothetical protein
MRYLLCILAIGVGVFLVKVAFWGPFSYIKLRLHGQSVTGIVVARDYGHDNYFPTVEYKTTEGQTDRKFFRDGFQNLQIGQPLKLYYSKTNLNDAVLDTWAITAAWPTFIALLLVGAGLLLEGILFLLKARGR